jgi:hypothetical protein
MANAKPGRGREKGSQDEGAARQRMAGRSRAALARGPAASRCRGRDLGFGDGLALTDRVERRGANSDAPGRRSVRPSSLEVTGGHSSSLAWLSISPGIDPIEHFSGAGA